MFTNLLIDHINTSIAESSGDATRKGSPTGVLENRANQLPLRCACPSVDAVLRYVSREIDCTMVELMSDGRMG